MYFKRMRMYCTITSAAAHLTFAQLLVEIEKDTKALIINAVGNILILRNFEERFRNPQESMNESQEIFRDIYKYSGMKRNL